MLVQHNTFFRISDHLSEIVNNEFVGCIAGKEYQCHRTKTGAIVNCIGNDFFEQLKSSMQESPYSLMLDASNDTGIEKMFPITVRIFYINFNRIMTKFFDMNLLTGRRASTAEEMLNSVDEQLTNNDISWEYCTALGVDNTNTNIGEYNSLKSRAIAKNASLVVVGCPCHILHNASQKSGAEFAKVVGFDLEDHSVDLSYWFHKSSKRKSILKEYNEFCNEEYADVVEFASTRWLSLEKCISREIDKFDGIKSYFLSENHSEERFKRLKQSYEDSMTIIYLRFYHSTLPVFNNFNKLLQSEDPLIYRLHEAQHTFMTKLISKFVDHHVIQNHLSQNKPFTSLDVSRCNQVDDEELSVGLLTQELIDHLLNEYDVTPRELQCFYKGVRAFFSKAFQYCCMWLRLDDDLLKYCVFADVRKRADTPFSYVEKTLPYFHIFIRP